MSHDWSLHPAASALEYEKDGRTLTAEVGPNDTFLVTNGSPIADLALGSMSAAPELHLTGQPWALWQRLTHARPEFGRPDASFGEEHIPDTAWVAYKATTSDPIFFELMRDFTGTEPGREGLIASKDSAGSSRSRYSTSPNSLTSPMTSWSGGALVSSPMPRGLS